MTRLTAAFQGIVVASARRCALALAAVVTLLGVSGSSDPVPGSFTLREQARGPLASSSGGFTKVTSGDLVTIPAWYWNGSWGDYDDDGYLDLFVGSSYASTTNYLYHNERDGTFALIDQADMPKSPSNQHGAVWGDYDNDGHLDLIVTSGNPERAQNMLYRNDGDGTFSWITEGPLYTQSGTFHAPGWGDYDNDGFLDLFIAGHGAVNRLFHNEGDGSFTRNSSHRVVLDVASSYCSAFVDYDNDGDIDLFVCNEYHANFLYRNDGHGVFTSVTDSGLSNVEGTIGCAWADYDNDGFLDLFLGNVQTNSLYHNEGDTFTSVTDIAGVQDVLPPHYLFVGTAWGDYDNDGFIDLFVSVGNCYPSPPCAPPFHSFLYHNEGDGTFSKVTEGIVVTDPTFTAPGSSWGDYDNDGFLDLFVAQGYFEPEPHINLLYHNDGNANAWLNVKLVGTRSNRSAIGAKVRVKAFYRGASRWQLREISGGGDGAANQQSLNAEFGLADATTIDTLRVEWPSGTVQELHDVEPRQFLTVTEPGVRPACADGVDDDGDGLSDMGDPGCPFPLASPENPQCDDGIDNDGNGLVDFDDPKCESRWPYWETLPCGLGAELALLLPLLGVGRRLDTRGRR